MNRRRSLRIIIAVAAILLVLLYIPEPTPSPVKLPAKRPFAWNQDSRWEGLESRFRELRPLGCEGLETEIDVRLAATDSLMEIASSMELQPDALILEELEEATFQLGPMIAACPERVPEYLARVAQLRSIVKDQSLEWDLSQPSARNRLYRIIYGGRAASEEVLLQMPPGSVPSLLMCDDEPSQSPSAIVLGVSIRSGDILVSRGGAPTSSLIARGSDYPGNFSHVALVHVDERTNVPSVLEAHIERGVTISSLSDYLNDVKLRVMVLRLRSDLPALTADPLLPQRVATRALESARARHIPYDFAMDFRDTIRLFCSEVASAPYAAEGIQLWRGLSTISSSGLASWLAAFGVEHFETQEPSDLEYDPQLRVVAEWRDPETLLKDHVDNATIDVLLEGAEAGEPLSYNWLLLPVARVMKGYSLLLNVFGKVGPVPEGMSATAALRNKRLSAWHEQIREGVGRRIVQFRQEKGYTPPYWELLKMARAEYGAIR
jgi:Permuted papain-like amidase enzyme, YaeF/YiiX, C92 family